MHYSPPNVALWQCGGDFHFYPSFDRQKSNIVNIQLEKHDDLNITVIIALGKSDYQEKVEKELNKKGKKIPAVSDSNTEIDEK